MLPTLLLGWALALGQPPAAPEPPAPASSAPNENPNGYAPFLKPRDGDGGFY